MVTARVVTTQRMSIPGMSDVLLCWIRVSRAPVRVVPSHADRPWPGSRTGIYESVLCFLINGSSRSMGTGKIVVEFFSAEISTSVWRNLNCNAVGSSAMMSAASLRRAAA